MADLAVLRTAKLAVDEGLIGNDEYEQIKLAFTKAQQIKAGLDAGFIREEDYIQARTSFLQSLDFRVQEQHHHQTPLAAHPIASFTQLVAPAPAPAPAPPPARQNQPSRRSGPAPTVNGHLNNVSLSAAQSNNSSSGGMAPAAAAPPPPAPPPPMIAPVIAQRPTAATIVSAPPQSTSGVLAGTIPVPWELGRIGRAGAADGKKSMSGIGLHDFCINVFNHIKTRSTFKWVSYKIDDGGNEVIIDQLGAPDSTYEQFISTLPANQCRYAVYDYAYSNNDTGQVNQKLVFVHWAPISSTIKSKMMYASTKEFIKGFLEGIGAELQADSLDELSEDEMVSKIASGMARK